jgi:hypothetical protein
MSFSALSVGSFSVDDPIPSDETEVVSTVDDTSDTTETSTQETDTTELDTSTVSETTEATDNTESEPFESTSEQTEYTPEPAYVSPITVEIVSETDNTVTLSGFNLLDAVTYKIISNGMIIVETFSIENYTLTGLNPGSYFEFTIEAYNIDGSLIGQSEPLFGYTDLTVSSNYTLYGDLVVADLTVNDGVFNLNGYSLTVMNDANINSGTLDINSGGIYINGDASFGYTSNYSYIYLDMTNASDYMLVKGDFYFRSYYSQSGYLTAGTLEVKGDFTQRSSSNNAGFYASGTHTTILTGEGL